ncbi:MAG: GIY-YIG nuclease family protein [Candidatus Omnitrophica bacterium]|nr:GIY-YIG nuclease family protein [Candidatus Omnitrophota bacterium]
MYYVYVLLSLKDKKFYIGFSEDVKKRLADHNAGRNTSTKPRRPLKLIYYEAHLDPHPFIEPPAKRVFGFLLRKIKLI